jgi:hypothetical protein
LRGGGKQVRNNTSYIEQTADAKLHQNGHRNPRARSSPCAARGNLPRYVPIKLSTGNIQVSGAIIVNAAICEFVGQILFMGVISEDVTVLISGYIVVALPLGSLRVRFLFDFSAVRVENF